MRISELGRLTGVPVATIKYYLRSELLHDGELTSPTQAQYNESHVTRLRLIRALIGPGGLSIAATRVVLDEIDHPREDLLESLGAVLQAAGPQIKEEVDLSEAEALIEGLGWQRDPNDIVTIKLLQHALDGIDAAKFELVPGIIETYATHLRAIAVKELSGTPTTSTEEAIRFSVLGTVLVEPMLLALRRMAHQDVAVEMFEAARMAGDPQHTEDEA